MTPKEKELRDAIEQVIYKFSNENKDIKHITITGEFLREPQRAQFAMEVKFDEKAPCLTTP